MNFLQIFQRTAEKCGLTSPSATTSQTGEHLRLLNNVNEAWLEIQSRHLNWNFMWARGTFDTTAGTKDYDPDNSTLNYLNVESMTAYDSDGESGEFKLDYVPYQKYRRYYDVGTHTNQIPTTFTVLPNRDIRLYPTPDDTYTLQFDYYLKPTELSGDSDTPELPSQHHMVIVWGAVRRYAEYEESAMMMQMSEAEYLRGLKALEREELPRPHVRLRPLA